MSVHHYISEIPISSFPYIHIYKFYLHFPVSGNENLLVITYRINTYVCTFNIAEIRMMFKTFVGIQEKSRQGGWGLTWN